MNNTVNIILVVILITLILGVCKAISRCKDVVTEQDTDFFLII